MKKSFCIILIFFSLNALGQSEKENWVDSVFSRLSEEEKIGQLLVVPVSSRWEKIKLNDVEKELGKQGLGGILFTSGNPQKQLSITNEFQSQSKVPMLIAMDALTGAGRLLDSTIYFGSPLSLAALAGDSLFIAGFTEIALQLQMLGVNLTIGLNALPADSASRQKEKFFSDQLNVVADRGRLAFETLRGNRILATAGDFSIRGATVMGVTDGIPTIKAFVDSTRLLAFEQLITSGIPVIKTKEIDLPVFYESKAALKKNSFNGQMISAMLSGQWLRERFGFEGLVMVDARPLEDQKKVNNGEAEMLAFRSGNDLIITDYPEATVRKIRRILKKRPNLKSQLDVSVKRILAAKYDAGLLRRPRLPAGNLLSRLNADRARLVEHKINRSSITVLRNYGNMVPILSLENKSFCSIVVGDTARQSLFHSQVGKYVRPKKVSVKEGDDVASIASAIAAADVSIVAITPMAKQELVDKVFAILQPPTGEKPLIVADFGNAFATPYLDRYPQVIESYEYTPQKMSAVPQLIFGSFGSLGVLPTTLSSFSIGTSIKTRPLARFEYSFPADGGLSSKTLKKIDGIAAEAINTGATPGCHVLVARHGKVVFEKSYGHLTYEKQIPVTDSTLYDLASITKVSATLQAVMFLYDRGMIDIYRKASYYLPELKNSNKKDFTLKDILTHQAGLWPFLPFWAQTMKDNVHLPEFYRNEPSLEYPWVVADKLYANVGMKDSLWNWIIKAKIREKPTRTPYDYRYSDMGFYMLHHLSEKLLNQPMEDFLEQNLYEPLGAGTTGYLPLLQFPVTRIAPTEQDTLFRKTLLIGTVHDQGAAMHGGVAGHAGLFSTANDLAKLGQMLLQEGYYGGYQYYRPETVRLFTAKQYETSPRGLGWHKPVQSDSNSPTSLWASPRTFGHTGFTGTCIWVDPEFDLVYVFLSNRVHPDMTNNKLLTGNIRSRIQDVIYESIFDYCKQESRTVAPAVNFEASRSNK